MISLALPTLTLVGGTLDVLSNGHLAPFDLPALTSVGRSVHVTGNSALASLNLPQLASLIRDFEVVGNVAHAQCLVYALVERVQEGAGIGGQITTIGNREGCTCEQVEGVVQANCP